MRTIPEVIDCESESTINADDFFSKDISDIFKQRHKLEMAIQEKRELWVCPLCRQPIKIKGKRGGERSLHFSHLPNQLDCPYKTGKAYTRDQILRMKYNGQKESQKHEFLKKMIAYKLGQDSRFTDIKVEARFEGICKNWRKPDVSAVFNGKRIVFELQLTTTFLSIITERNIFYRDNETYIIWIFGNKDKNINEMRFMEKDIFYPNHHNAFFIDDNSDDLNFTLICGYERPYLSNKGIEKEWQTSVIDFSDLTFDDSFQVYWYNYEKEFATLEKNFRHRQLSKFTQKWWNAKTETDRINAIDELCNIHKIQIVNINHYELIALLNCLYSIKFKKVIGYKFIKLIQVLHKYFDRDTGQNEHFGDYVFKAIRLYCARSQILQEDKTRKYIKKESRYKNSKFNLCHKYDQIIEFLFPEIFADS